MTVTTTTTTTTTAKPSSARTSSASSASSTCAPLYTGGATTISGTGTLPKPTAFVKRAAGSQKLTVSGKEYRIVGPSASPSLFRAVRPPLDAN